MWFHTGFLYLFSCFSVVILVSLSLAVLLHTCALPPPGYSPLSHFPTLSQMLPHLMHFSHLSCLGFHHLSGVDAPRLFCVQAFPTTHLCASYLPCMCFPSLHMLTSLSRASPLLCSPPPCASVLLVLLSLCKHASPVSCFPMRFPPHALPPSHCTPSQSLIMLFLSPCLCFLHLTHAFSLPCVYSLPSLHTLPPSLTCFSPSHTCFHLLSHTSPLLACAATFSHMPLSLSHACFPLLCALPLAGTLPSLLCVPPFLCLFPSHTLAPQSSHSTLHMLPCLTHALSSLHMQFLPLTCVLLLTNALPLSLECTLSLHCLLAFLCTSVCLHLACPSVSCFSFCPPFPSVHFLLSCVLSHVSHFFHLSHTHSNSYKFKFLAFSLCHTFQSLTWVLLLSHAFPLSHGFSFSCTSLLHSLFASLSLNFPLLFMLSSS